MDLVKLSWLSFASRNGFENKKMPVSSITTVTMEVLLQKDFKKCAEMRVRLNPSVVLVPSIRIQKQNKPYR